MLRCRGNRPSRRDHPSPCKPPRREHPLSSAPDGGSKPGTVAQGTLRRPIRTRGARRLPAHTTTARCCNRSATSAAPGLTNTSAWPHCSSCGCGRRGYAHLGTSPSTLRQALRRERLRKSTPEDVDGGVHTAWAEPGWATTLTSTCPTTRGVRPTCMTHVSPAPGGTAVPGTDRDGATRDRRSPLPPIFRRCLGPKALVLDRLASRCHRLEPPRSWPLGTSGRREPLHEPRQASTRDGLDRRHSQTASPKKCRAPNVCTPADRRALSPNNP